MSIVISLIAFVVTFVVTFVITSVMTVIQFGSTAKEERNIVETSLGMALLVIGCYWFMQSAAEVMAMSGIVFLDSVRRVSHMTNVADTEFRKVSDHRTDEMRKAIRRKLMSAAAKVAVSVASELKPGTVVYSSLLDRFEGSLKFNGIYHVANETYVVRPKQFQIVEEYVHCDGLFVHIDDVMIKDKRGHYRKGIPAGDKLDSCKYGLHPFGEVLIFEE